MKVIEGGIETLTEDWPGRLHLGRIGVAQSGAVDGVSLRVANLLVGNPLGEVGFEVRLGFEAEFTHDALIAITGADAKPTINGQGVPLWQSILVGAGDVIAFKTFPEFGMVSYVGIAGGIAVPTVWGSKSTCTKEGYGGYQGRKLQAGDELQLKKIARKTLKTLESRNWEETARPAYQRIWEVRAVPGPNSAPEYFTEEGMELWYSAPFKIDHNSGRLGYRIRHPKPILSRPSGGEAGHHASMMPMQPYRAPGALNVCGDFGVILMHDAINAGGYVVALSVILADLWKVGQATPLRDSIHFQYCTVDEARETLLAQENSINEAFVT